ncbi:MAG: cyclase family protein, partial [Sedimentisphaerales bacterium]|nr:cyclase family protein [Sedimentisphaerales bacterium]
NAAPYNKPALKITPVERFEYGDTADTSLVEVFNHCGTHIDLPGHKIRDGKTLSDSSIEEFIFERPYIVDIPLQDEQNALVSDFEPYKQQLSQCDLLLIRSGFSRFRQTDKNRYVWKTPGVSVEAAKWLMQTCPQLKAIGMDFLSFETLGDTSHKSQAHLAVLQRNVKIIEDLNLDNLANGKILRVFAFPLFIEGVDSFHATVAAEIIE